MEEQRETGGGAVDFGDQHLGARAFAEQLRGEPRLVGDNLMRQLFVFAQLADEGEDQPGVGGDGRADGDNGLRCHEGERRPISRPDAA